MKNEILHVFRNTPFGREVFLHSLYFAKNLGLNVKVYVPRYRQFLMYFRNAVVTVDLDSSFLFWPETAREHARALAEERGVSISFLEPTDFTASTLPDIPVDFGLMCCPRSISDLSAKISLGYIGPAVRSIVQNASFPVFIPTPVYKEWKHIVVFFGGSQNASRALQLGYELRARTQFPMSVFTYATTKPREHYVKLMQEGGLFGPVESGDVEWLFMTGLPLKAALYAVPHDALAIIGAYGHGPVKEVLFGSMMEQVQTMLPASLLIVGPHFARLEI